MYRHNRHIALLLLFLLSVFTFPKALWHHHEEPVKVAHQDCEHASHLEEEDLDCTLCQFHTPTFFPGGKVEHFNNLPTFDYPACFAHQKFTQNTFALPFLRGPPDFS